MGGRGAFRAGGGRGGRGRGEERKKERKRKKKEKKDAGIGGVASCKYGELEINKQ
jgi:hypothetical protein